MSGRVAVPHTLIVLSELPDASLVPPASKPYADLTGKAYLMDDGDGVFGCRCIYYVHSVHREDKGDLPSKRGIWLGRHDTVASGHWVAELTFDFKAQDWVIGKPEVAVGVTMQPEVFPLRMGASQSDAGAELADFNSFVDKFDSNGVVIPKEDVLEGVGEGDALAQDNVWEVEKIVAKRSYKKKVQYRIRWKGWDEMYDQWTYLSKLAGAKELVDEFNGVQVNTAKCYSGRDEGTKQWDDHARAVVHLLDKHRIEGTVDDWMPGYLAEFNAVKDRRLVEVTDTDLAQKILKSGKYVKLRMNPEPKKRTGRKKCRLIAQGFMEPYSWDPGPTDSPVVCFDSLGTLLFKGGRSNEVISSVDISTAFLQADEFGQEESPRYVTYQPYKGARTQVYRLRGPLYGSRRASYRWYETLKKVLVQMGFEKSHSDPAVFKKGDFVVACWVDDLICRGGYDDSVKFYDELRERFDLKDEPKYLTDADPLEYVGFRITMRSKGQEQYYYIDQEDDIKEFLEHAGVFAVRRVQSPMPRKHELTSDLNPATPDEKTWFQRVYGSLSWFTNVTRYDMAHTVHRLGQCMAPAKITKGAIKAMKRALQYLACTTSFKIGGLRVPQNEVYMASDSDCGGDVATRLTTRSCSGRVILLNGVPVEWAAKKQMETADSPAVAEIYAMSTAVKAGNLYRWKCRDMGMVIQGPQRPVVHVDNKQCSQSKRVVH